MHVVNIFCPDLELRLSDVPNTGSSSGLSLVVVLRPLQTQLDVGNGDQQVEDENYEHCVLQ